MRSLQPLLCLLIFAACTSAPQAPQPPAAPKPSPTPAVTITEPTPAPVTAAPAAAPSAQVLSSLPVYGDNSAAVKALQEQLALFGLILQVDGSFGPQTKKAIEEVQKTKNLAVTGTLTEETLKALNLSIAAGKPEQPLLSWNKPSNPERLEWTKTLFEEFNKRYASIIKASDSKVFCPNFTSLPKDKQLWVWAEMFVWTAYYESSWNPKSYSVDVGTKNNKDTWSAGLLQLSVVDGPNKQYGYSFDELLNGSKNLRLGIAILANQVDRYGAILIKGGPSQGLYWATLHPGGRYDKTDNIAAHTKALPFCK